MSKLETLRPARITEPRFWLTRTTRPAFAVLCKQRVLSKQRLAAELAEVASGLRAEDTQIDRVISAYRREHGLTSEQIHAERQARPIYSGLGSRYGNY